MLSVVIPAYNEADCIAETVTSFHKTLDKYGIDHEILVINDHSKDTTVDVLESLMESIKQLRYINNDYNPGFGSAIIKGLHNFDGDYVTIAMADLSDDPEDLVAYYNKMQEGYDCVFGSRFIKGSKLIDYPWFKLILNRLCNNFIKVLFWLPYNDITNPYKLYTREAMHGLEPFISRQFNLEVELPLKAIIRGYSYAILPNSWRNRTEGIAKFKIQEAGSRYLFIILYCLIEKILSRGDYNKEGRDAG